MNELLLLLQEYDEGATISSPHVEKYKILQEKLFYSTTAPASSVFAFAKENIIKYIKKELIFFDFKDPIMQENGILIKTNEKLNKESLRLLYCIIAWSEIKYNKSLNYISSKLPKINTASIISTENKIEEKKEEVKKEIKKEAIRVETALKINTIKTNEQEKADFIEYLKKECQ